MRAGIMSIGTALALVATPALADEALPDPQSYVREECGGAMTVDADVERGSVVVTAAAVPARVYRWTIPGWYRDVAPACSYGSVLAMTDNVPLSPTNGGDTPIFVYARAGADGAKRMSVITLDDLSIVDPVRTESHYLIADGVVDTDAGWEVVRDGKVVAAIDAADGTVSR